MVGHIERFNPPVRKLRELIGEGRLGEVLAFRAKRLGRPDKLVETGVIKDLGVHDFDVLRFLLGREPRSVLATCWYPVRPQVEDQAEIFLLFDRCVGEVEVSRVATRVERGLALIGELGHALLDYRLRTLRMFDPLGEVEFRFRGDPLELELSHFFDCVLYDREPAVTGLDGLRALEIAEAALRSAHLGEEVPIARSGQTPAGTSQ